MCHGQHTHYKCRLQTVFLHHSISLEISSGVMFQTFGHLPINQFLPSFSPSFFCSSTQFAVFRYFVVLIILKVLIKKLMSPLVCLYWYLFLNKVMNPYTLLFSSA